MSHYKPYPAYKDSGVEWLGKVPAHWSIERVANNYSLRNGYPFESGKFVPEGEPKNRLIRIRDLSPTETFLFTTEPCPESTVILNGDLLIGMDGDFNICQWKGGQAKLNQRVCALRGETDINTRFLLYCLSAPLKIINDVAYSTTVKHLASGEVLSIRLPAPPIDELKLVVAHLDRETSRIDALVNKKTRFMELLREKRQALITHTVTKGLDPSVKMKDSGVEWLGDVPEHWTVCKLSFRYAVELGKMLDEKRITGECLLPYLRNQDVQWDTVNIDALPQMDIAADEIDRYTVCNSDLLVCEGGDVGRAAIWRGPNKTIGYQKAIHRLRPRSATGDSAEFLFFSLVTAKARGVFEESDAKATIAHLPAEKFRQYRFAFPSLAEQLTIAASLRLNTTRMDALIQKTQHSIDLLKERRAALITAAVTGQIDLRQAA
jgi:type I restriction enzyme S subunit